MKFCDDHEWCSEDSSAECPECERVWGSWSQSNTAKLPPPAPPMRYVKSHPEDVGRFPQPAPPTKVASVVVDSLVELRKIRLYHWQAVMNLRSYAVGCPKDADKHYNKKADMHLGYVQTLNVFFEHGDTAESDLEKQANGKT